MAKRRRLVVNHSPDRSSDFQPESSLDRDTPNSSEPIESDGIGNPLTSVQKFPSINLPSNINIVDFDLARDEFMIPSSYSLLIPETHHKIYNPIEHNGQQFIGVSRAAFMCGLRLPLHPFVRYVLEDSGIALGQLMPNSFFQINAFIARSRDRAVNLNSHLFWHHYHVSLSPKCPGCYIFARRPGKQQWTGTHSNNRGCHEEWFFVSGPGLENVSRWTTNPPRIESELDDVHLKLYKQLTSKHHSLLIWSPAQLRNEEFLLLYRVSSRDADLKEVERRRRLQNKAKLEKLALKKKQRLQPEASDSMVIVTPTQTPSGSIPDQPSRPTVTKANQAKVIASHDSPDPKRSKSSPIMELPDELTEQASAASKAFSRSLLASIPMSKDQAKKFSLGSVRSSGQTVAFISQGCDASVLLDDTANFTGEKTAPTNSGSLRGFDVVDTIKTQLESSCAGVVSCADILAVAARDSVVALGGTTWTVVLGRRDSTTASLSTVNSDIPGPNLNLNGLISSFSKKGFTTKEMVTLSGAHTIGQARCQNFRNRAYNEANISPSYQTTLQGRCPRTGSNNNLAPLDIGSATTFDNSYFTNLVSLKGLLHSDQVLFNNGSTDAQVSAYSSNQATFLSDFASAMVKMGNLSPLTGTNGQIRTNCRKTN